MLGSADAANATALSGCSTLRRCSAAAVSARSGPRLTLHLIERDEQAAAGRVGADLARERGKSACERLGSDRGLTGVGGVDGDAGAEPGRGDVDRAEPLQRVLGALPGGPLLTETILGARDDPVDDPADAGGGLEADRVVALGLGELLKAREQNGLANPARTAENDVVGPLATGTADVGEHLLPLRLE
jgi:hypothetical protein